MKELEEKIKEIIDKKTLIGTVMAKYLAELIIAEVKKTYE